MNSYEEGCKGSYFLVMVSQLPRILPKTSWPSGSGVFPFVPLFSNRMGANSRTGQSGMARLGGPRPAGRLPLAAAKRGLMDPCRHGNPQAGAGRDSIRPRGSIPGTHELRPPSLAVRFRVPVGSC